MNEGWNQHIAKTTEPINLKFSIKCTSKHKCCLNTFYYKHLLA